jgi:hypothetical protein
MVKVSIHVALTMGKDKQPPPLNSVHVGPCETLRLKTRESVNYASRYKQTCPSLDIVYTSNALLNADG